MYQRSDKVREYLTIGARERTVSSVRNQVGHDEMFIMMGILLFLYLDVLDYWRLRKDDDRYLLTYLCTYVVRASPSIQSQTEPSAKSRYGGMSDQTV